MVSIAVPLRDQCSWIPGFPIGMSIAKMKLVDWPVVESVPALTEVLYTGHLYLFESSWDPSALSASS